MQAGVNKIIAHGMVGGIGNVLNGGKFGHGFFSAGFTQSLSETGFFKDKPVLRSDRFKNALKAALVGGTVSRLTGGKFANGAITGAFSRLLNDDSLGSQKGKKYKKNGNIESALDEAADDIEVNLKRHKSILNDSSNREFAGVYYGDEVGVVVYIRKPWFGDAYVEVSDTGIMGRSRVPVTEGLLDGGSAGAPDSDAVAVVRTTDYNAEFFESNRFLAVKAMANIGIPVYVITPDNVWFKLWGQDVTKLNSLKIESNPK